MPEKLFKTKAIYARKESSGYFLSLHLKEHPTPGNHLIEAPGDWK